jgi:putative peptide zinc metalloprotease protein
MTALEESSPASAPAPAPAPTWDTPSLAPGVELSGPMQGSAFVEQQWLIQRDGSFLQVSELLYRVAEQCNGRNSPEKIASRLTRSTQWQISPEQVRYILESRLAPLGIVTDELKRFALVRAQNRDPLRVQFRIKALGPRLLDPVASKLALLFHPAFLVPSLALIVVFHAWFYAFANPGRSIGLVLSDPTLVVMLFGLTLAATLFHELGHASALASAGGRARSIGFGFYLFYPAFYTDVTDSYRLSRKDRVRVDAGGVYFHFLLSSWAIFAYLLTGMPVLQVLVLVITVDAARQMLPIGRLDGYWIISDLTGIPDMFSRVFAFVRGRFPGSKPQAAAPIQKRAATALGLYMAVALPFLFALLGYIAWHLPETLTELRNALVLNLEGVATAVRAGEFTLALAFATSAATMGLVLAGFIAFMLVLLAVFARSLSRRFSGTAQAGASPVAAGLQPAAAGGAATGSHLSAPRVAHGVISAARQDSRSASPAATPRPARAAEDALVMSSVTSPVPRGGTATVTARAMPGATCSIAYRTPSGRISRSAALVQREADAHGEVAWSWSINGGTSAGMATVMVSSGGRSVSTEVVIT